jgi:hypothetical protein
MLIRSSAEEVLRDRGLSFKFWEEKYAIKMSDGVIFCTFERLVQGISDTEEDQKIKTKLVEF